MIPLEGKVVLVTGSADRAGAVFARRFAASGAAVVVNHLPSQAGLAAGVVAEITAQGGRAVAAAADIAGVGQAQALVDATLAAFGRLDILVHNASSFHSQPWLEVAESAFDASLGVNLKGPFFLSQAAAKVMLAQGAGRIIALVGNSLVESWPDFIPHALGKTALARLMEHLAVALTPVVSCNAVAPSQFFRSDDGANDRLRAGRGEVVQSAETFEARPGVRLREVDVEAVFEALLYYSTCSPTITGTTLRVDGGKALV